MEAILSSSLRESRLVVLFYRPSSGQSEEMEALDFIFHQSMDIVESSGETVHWIRDEPFSRLPAMASIPHPAALNLLKLHYAGDQILECLSHVQNEAAPKEDGSYVASLDFSPSSHLNGEENDQPSMGPCALVVLPYSSTRAHVASMYTDVMWSFNENNEFKSLTYWDEQFVRSEE